MRLIDADALWEIFREKQNSLTARCGGYRFLDDEDRAEYDRLEITLAYIENAPEVDAVPVVRGEWVEAKSGVMSVWPPGQVMCSVCGQRMPLAWKKTPPYCYGCGAKMEGEGST